MALTRVVQADGTVRWVDNAAPAAPSVTYDVFGNVVYPASTTTTRTNRRTSNPSRQAASSGPAASAVVTTPPGVAQQSSTRTELEKWYGPGNVPSGLVNTAITKGWTDIDIRRYALTHGANGPNAVLAREDVLNIARSVRGPEWTATLTPAQIDVLAGDTYTDPTAYLTNYFTDALGLDIMQSPLVQKAIDDYIAMTGKQLSWTAQQKLGDILRANGGWNNTAQTQWEEWIPTTNAAKTGNWGATHRADIISTLTPLLGRAPTEEELKADGPLWNLNPDALTEYAKTTPEYQARFAGKPADVSESQYLTDKNSWTAVLRQAYGINIADLSGFPGTYGDPTQTGTVQLTDEGRKKMEAAGFATYADWEANYENAAPGWFEKKALDSGWITKGGGPGFSSIDSTLAALMADGYKNNYTPEQWMQSVQWNEQAIVNEGTYDPILLETMGLDLSHEDWYKYSSKAIGWGEIQLQIMEAQNKIQYREVYRDYFGTDPSPADYDAVTTAFVSPSEFVHRMAAKESASAQIGQANELLGRVMGTSVTLADLENLAMGGQGSGALRAQLDQASRLDEYRWEHKQKYGTEPTPTDYAKYAGYAGPAELKWELTLAENMAEFGPDIKETWAKAYPDNPLTDAQLHVMLGDMKGSGDLKYKLKEAQAVVTKEETAHDAGFSTVGANIMFSGSPQGGFKLSMPGIEDMVPSMN